MSISQVVQRQSMHYNGPMALLKHILIQLAGTVDISDDKKLRVFNCIDLSLADKCVTLEVIV
jgi:Pre-mRNA 3'-end-processing endonuclease polyadenylation factor C-term